MLLESGKEKIEERIKLIYRNNLIEYAEKSLFYFIELIFINKIYELEMPFLESIIHKYLNKKAPKKIALSQIYWLLGNAFLEQYLGNFINAKSNLEEALVIFESVNIENQPEHQKKGLLIYGLILYKILRKEKFCAYQKIRMKYPSTNSMIDLDLICEIKYNEIFDVFKIIKSFEEGSMPARVSALTCLMDKAFNANQKLFENISFKIEDWDALFWNGNFKGPYFPSFAFEIDKNVLNINLSLDKELPINENIIPFLESFFTIFDTIDQILNKNIISNPFFIGNTDAIYSFLKAREYSLNLKIGNNLSKNISKKLLIKVKDSLETSFKWINQKNKTNIVNVYFKGSTLKI